MELSTRKTAFDRQFAREVDLGLREKPMHLPTRFIYDDEGSRLFEEIMKLPEYYLSRAEREILETYKKTISDHFGKDKFNLIEFGAGNGEKTAILLEHLLQDHFDFRYIPIDISKAAIKGLEEKLKKRFHTLEFSGRASDYFEGLKAVKEHSGRRNVVLFMGSNIGNFQKNDQDHFMSKLSECLNKNDLLLIGFDLVKDYEIIRRAYYDKQGMTARFNLNLIHRINRELEGNFKLDKMHYYSAYNPGRQRNEAYLYSTIDQKIHIKATGKDYDLPAFEPINTEYSYKYYLKDIDSMALKYGFKVLQHFSDRQTYFIDSLWDRQ